MRALLAAGLLALGACSSPPLRYEGPLGSVYADDPEQGALVQAELEELGPRVQAILHTDPGPPRIIVARSRNLGPRHAMGATSAKGIVLAQAAFAEDGLVRLALGHELVHWYAVGVWDGLSPVIEEGLADFVACGFFPDGVELRAEENRALGITIDPTAFELDLEAFQALSSEAEDVARRRAFELVRVVGVERLHGSLIETTSAQRAQ